MLGFDWPTMAAVALRSALERMGCSHGGKATAPHREGYYSFVQFGGFFGFPGHHVCDEFGRMNLVVLSARICILQGNLVPKGD